MADVIPDLLADYAAECKDWTFLAGEHWRQKRWGRALDLLGKAIQRVFCYIPLVRCFKRLSLRRAGSS